MREPEHTDRDGSDRGGELLAEISNQVVRTLKESYGKGADRAKSYMFDDLLFVVMRGGETAAEQTLLAAGEEDLVRTYRLHYQKQMYDELTGLVARLTGRKVVTYQSQVLFDPFMSIEMFVFESGDPAAG